MVTGVQSNDCLMANQAIESSKSGELRGRLCTVIDPSYAQKQNLRAGDGDFICICIAATLLFLSAVSLIVVGAVLAVPVCAAIGGAIIGAVIAKAICMLCCTAN